MKKFFLLAGLCAAAAAPSAFANDSCAMMSGSYTLKTHGAHFIARLETYTTKITLDPAGSSVVVKTNWGPDYTTRLNYDTHTVSEQGNATADFGQNVAGNPNAYLDRLETVLGQLTQLQLLKVREGKSDPKASEALECAINRYTDELNFARTQKIIYDQARGVAISKVTNDINLNKTVTVNVNNDGQQQNGQNQQQQGGSGQTKTQ